MEQKELFEEGAPVKLSNDLPIHWVLTTIFTFVISGATIYSGYRETTAAVDRLANVVGRLENQMLTGQLKDTEHDANIREISRRLDELSPRISELRRTR